MSEHNFPRFPLPILLCAGYSVKLFFFFVIIMTYIRQTPPLISMDVPGFRPIYTRNFPCLVKKALNIFNWAKSGNLNNIDKSSWPVKCTRCVKTKKIFKTNYSTFILNAFSGVTINFMLSFTFK